MPNRPHAPMLRNILKPDQIRELEKQFNQNDPDAWDALCASPDYNVPDDIRDRVWDWYMDNWPPVPGTNRRNLKGSQPAQLTGMPPARDLQQARKDFGDARDTLLKAVAPQAAKAAEKIADSLKREGGDTLVRNAVFDAAQTIRD